MRGRSKTLQRMKEGMNQAVKERQRAVAIEKYQNHTKKDEWREKRLRERERQSPEWGRSGGQQPCCL